MPTDNFDKIAKEGNLLDRLERGETRVRSTTRKNVRSARLSNIANELGEVDFRAVDTDGNLRVVMSAYDLFDELGVHAHLAGLDATGDVQFYLSADDGTVVAANGNVVLSQNGIDIYANVTYDPFITFYDGAAPLGFIYINISGALEVAAFDHLYLSAPNGVHQFIKMTDLSYRGTVYREDPANVNVTQFDVGPGAAGGKISIGGAVVIWARKDGTETVFNDDSYDIDHRWEGATDANLLKLDGGLDGIGMGGAAEAGYKLKVTGGINVTDNYYRNGTNILALIPRSGQMINGKITPTVVSNDLVLTLQTAGGATPSASDPVLININGTVRTVTAATSCTLADGTNWFNAGSAELGLNAHDYFAYAVWDSNSSVVAIAPARIPWARLVSDFSATTTNEKFIGNQSNYTSTDDVCVIGRFQATLSIAGTSHVWTVPTFTNANLIQEPVFETQWRDWNPAYSCSGSLTYTSITTLAARYIIREKTIEVVLSASGTLGGSASTRIGFTLPFEGEQSGIATPPIIGAGWNGNANTMCVAFLVGATPDRCDLFNYNLGNWATSGTATIRATGKYEAD